MGRGVEGFSNQMFLGQGSIEVISPSLSNVLNSPPIPAVDSDSRGIVITYMNTPKYK